MIILINGKEVARTSSSKFTGIDSKTEALMFEQAYHDLGFTGIELKAEYRGPNTKPEASEGDTEKEEEG
jgi:hypothetical protein